MHKSGHKSVHYLTKQSEYPKQNIVSYWGLNYYTSPRVLGKVQGLRLCTMLSFLRNALDFTMGYIQKDFTHFGSVTFNNLS